MSHAHLRDGSIIHFPVHTDPVGVIEVPPVAELERIAREIVPHELPRFASVLLKGANRKRNNPRWVEVNEARLELARLCIGQMLSAPEAA